MTLLSHLKPWLVDSYRWATWPYRHVSQARARSTGKVPVAILFYHRVADDNPTPWTISTHDFEEHLAWLSDQFDIVSLPDAQSRIRQGTNDRPTVSITFDDGYADNSTTALPLLIKRGIPATYFVTTHNVTQQVAFDHDVDRGQAAWTNALEVIRAMAGAGIEIGAHTRTHADLGQVTCREQLVDEIVTATEELEAAIDRPIRYFAFPYGQLGNLSAAAFRVARDHGFAGVCSAYGGWNEIGDDPFHLKRFSGDPQLTRVRNWLTWDPRKRHAPEDAEVARMLQQADRDAVAPLPCGERSAP